MRTFVHQHAHARRASSPGRVLSGPGLRQASSQTARIRHILGRGAVKPKLTIGEPNDALEREADRVAEEVMRMEAPEPGPAMRMHASPPPMQRACSGCGELRTEASAELVQRQTGDEEEELLQPKRHVGQRGVAMSFPGLERPMLKSSCACGGGCSSCRADAVVPVDDRLERDADQVTDRVLREVAYARAPPFTTGAAATEAQDHGDAQEQAGQQAGPDLAWLRATHAGGEPLAPELRAFYEPRFGRDFSQVRLHRGPPAGARARALGARAYAFGRDIAFAPGEFSPRSIAGRRLIAHELAHVAQQGRAPPIGRRQRAGAVAPGLGLAQVSRRIQRACGPGEIGSPPDCERTTGDIFGTPFRFRADCDVFAAPSEEAGLRDAAGLIGRNRVNIHGFASAEGGTEYNYNLSCSRAHVAAAILRSHGADVVKLFKYGPTPGPVADRRSVVLEPLTTPTPEPEPVPPEPDTEREREPEPAEDNGCAWFNCSTPYNMFPSPLNDIVPDAIDCLCEGVKFLDIIEDFLALIPPLSPFFGNPLVQQVISIADVLCGVWDLLEMVFYAGCSPGPCWDPSHIDLIEAGRIAAFTVSLPVDYFSDSIFGSIVTALVEVLATIVEAIVTGAGFGSSGPVGAFIAFLGAETLKEAIAAAMRLILEFMVDLTTYLTQNQITHGTPFPLDSCRACAGLASQVGISDYSSYCDTVAALITPDFLHWESFDPQNSGGGG